MLYGTIRLADIKYADYETVKAKTGIEIINIPMQEIARRDKGDSDA